MSDRANKVKIGAFVVTALVLFAIVMAALGAWSFLGSRCVFMTIVGQSVQGLEKGAKVKFKGVSIGEVTDIKINPNDSNVLIFMEFNPEAIESSSGGDGFDNPISRDKALREFLRKQIAKGLRCQLRYGGISGNLYVEISLFDVSKHPVRQFSLPENHPPYLPSASSVLMDNILEQTQKSLTKIAAVDFVRLSEKAEELIDTGNQLLNNKDFVNAVREIKKLSESLRDLSEDFRQTIGGESVKELVDEMKVAMRDVNKASMKIANFIDESGVVIRQSEIPETFKTTRGFMNESKRSIIELRKLRDDVKVSLDKFNDTLKSAESLIDYLEKNPDSVIRGKSGERVVEP